MTRRIVILDMMDTILADPYREAIEAGTGRGLDELRPLLLGTRWPDFECNRITEQEYLAAFDDAGIELDRQAFHQARREGYAWVAGMDRLIDDLRRHVEVVIASNYPDWLDDVADEWFRARVDGVIGSCHLGERKPDRAFFDGVLAWLDAPAEATWFVDDRPHNVEAAAALGMRAHRFTTAEAVRAWLSDEGVLPT
ncbi:MAG: HAD-IA family hydrolase [Nitriliruptorales bacterium]|nr:HAD-IA family hydrolase [Nitriliruptorales bacterium]